MDISLLNSLDYTPLLLTLKLAIITTFFLLIIGVPIAYHLAFSKYKIKPAIEAVITLPLILPPTVLGFYLLLTFSPNSGLGLWLNEFFGIKLVFSFVGIVFGSIIYSLPFMVQPIQNAFSQIPESYIEMGRVLGKTKIEILRFILLPNIKKAVTTAIVLTFAHTIGEFGVVLMIGGSIPNETKVASISIYEKVEMLNYSSAHAYASILLIFSFTILILLYASKKHKFSIFNHL